MSALLSFGDVLEARFENAYCSPEEKTTRGATQRQFDRLVEQEWPELPYAMMRITAAAGSHRGRRMYWRDHCVQCSDIELNLIRSRSEDGTSIYTAIYSREDFTGENLRRDFLVPLHPSLEGHQLRWSAPGICDTANLTSEELAAVLLAKFVTFNASELLATDGNLLTRCQATICSA